MGKKLRKQAIQLGLTNLPKYTFFGRPRGVKAKFSKSKPDIAYVVEDWLNTMEPSFEKAESGSGRNNTFYYLAAQTGVYVEVFDKLAGISAFNENNHAIQIDIYTNNVDYVRAIVRNINNIWDDGILPHIDWKIIGKKYKVRREDVENAWNSFL